MAQPAKKRAPRIERGELERCFLSGIIANFGIGDAREITALFPGVSWRHFRDGRHRVIWRALSTLDLTKSFEERLDLLIAESGGKGDVEKLAKEARPLAWFERELLAAGALSRAGGRAYIRELAEACPVANRANIEYFAKKLEFMA